MAHHLAHDHTILLLYEALIAFLIRTSSREGNLLTHTKVSDFFIDKLPTVIGIEAQDRKREERSGALESRQHRLPPTVKQGKTFRPAGGDIGQRDRVQATTLYSPATVSHQVHLQEACFGLVPLCERPNRDLLF